MRDYTPREKEKILREGFSAIGLHWIGAMLTFGCGAALVVLYGGLAGALAAGIYIGGKFLVEGRRRILKIREEVEQ